VRVAVVSDIHANLEALEAVAADFGSIDAVWSLGDVVGYGPDPVACLDWVRSHAREAIPGNHDWAAIGKEVKVSTFNPAAAEAATWTAAQLSPADVAYLDGLALTRVVGAGDGAVTLAHGSPRDPIWEYLTDPEDAYENFDQFAGDLCLVGHSHIPVAFTLAAPTPADPPRLRIEPARYDAPLDLEGARRIVNVGSVGQPRDGDPAARYAILDLDRRTLEWRRVPYEVAKTQEKIRRVGLPDILWMRLAYGR
jgi:diadenosine tetraphosphatase ApaH/serine/threonine PP2A family protein phosphatase